jgi:hypothetical protein
MMERPNVNKEKTLEEKKFNPYTRFASATDEHQGQRTHLGNKFTVIVITTFCSCSKAELVLHFRPQRQEFRLSFLPRLRASFQLVFHLKPLIQACQLVNLLRVVTHDHSIGQAAVTFSNVGCFRHKSYTGKKPIGDRHVIALSNYFSSRILETRRAPWSRQGERFRSGSVQNVRPHICVALMMNRSPIHGALQRR